MQKTLVLTLTFILIASISFAAAFAPMLLEISAPAEIGYEFNGSMLDIPVITTGTPATVIFLVFTNNKASEISAVRNGYLGWHYVNHIDTCIYVSTDWIFPEPGQYTITWNGRDADGNLVSYSPDDYTYYLFAYDHVTPKQKAAPITIPWENASMWRTHDVAGLPMARPEFYNSVWQGSGALENLSRQKWIMGTDIKKTGAIETCTYRGYNEHSPYVPHPHDMHGFFSYTVDIASTGHVMKYEWVSNGVGMLDDSWGYNGEVTFSLQTSSDDWSKYVAAIEIGNDLIVASSTDISGVSNESVLKLIDVERGFIDRNIDLTDWWIKIDDGMSGGQKSSGPHDFSYRDGFLFMGSHGTCMNQVIAPHQDVDEPLWNRWVNQNGDYTGDHNFEDTADRKWVCHDYTVGPYKYSISCSENLFSCFPAYDMGAVSFGLYAPDGTGMGYYAFAGEHAGLKWMASFLANDSVYDGMYCDGNNRGDYALHFVAQDTFRGMIRYVNTVEEKTPAEFIVYQNSPNPFNQTTTISFTITDAGNIVIDVYNLAGQKVDTIMNEFRKPGTHSCVWDASGFSAGVYLYTVSSGTFSRTKTMTLLK